MNLMAMLERAQAGRLFAAIAESLDLDEAQTREAMTALCPAIARQLKAEAAEDDGLFQSLLDLIADGAESSPLEETDAVTGEEAVRDGNAILLDIYGTRNSAMVALRKVAAGVPERELTKLAPISATAVVAALAQANKPMALSGALPVSQASGGSGIIGTIVGAVLTGAVQGMVRELTSSRRWRSTTGYTRSRSKRKTASSRTKSTAKRKTGGPAAARNRKTSASIEDIFRDILGDIGK
jgi:hypothetical protein